MPNKKSDYHIYSHSDPGIDTMGSFVGDSLSIGLGLDIVKTLNYEDEEGRKNLDNLIALYSKEELTQFQSLINGVRNSVKQEVDNTSFINSTIGGNIVSTPVVNSPQPDSLITVKDPVKLNTAINDLSTYTSNKLNNSQEGFINQIPILEVRKLFTKFVFRVANETNYIVIFTSTKRTLNQELALARKGNKTISKNSNGFSYHIVGLAFDFNLRKKGTNTFIKQPIPVGEDFTIEERIKYTKEWEETGVIKIAKELNLKWGGDFKTTPFDPIHLDARNYYSVNKNDYLEAIKLNEVEDATSIPETSDSISQNSIYSDLPLKIGTILNLPLIDIDREVLITENNQAINTSDFGSFLARELYFLLGDPGYERTFVPKNKIFSIGEVKEIFPYMSVWVWSRALSVTTLTNEKNNYNHTILNITPYISSLNTSVSENGGQFSIDLAAIESEIFASTGNNVGGVGKGWQVSEKTQKASPLNEGDYVNHSAFHYEKDGQLKRSRFFFEKALQQNDIVFIRFEKLVLEESRENLNSLETISINQLPNQIFDMIGLIDTPSINSQPANGAVMINIAGRDLVKLLIEDGVYFYPYDFTDGGIFANETGAANQRLQRYNGQILTRFQTQNKTIDRSLKYILNALGSIDICPTDLFSGYANGIDRITKTTFDKRSKAYQLDDVNKNSIQNLQREIDDKKSKVFDKINKLRQSNNITQGSSNEVYNIIHEFLKQRIENKEIEDLYSLNIKSWSEVIDNQIVKNETPLELKDLLYIRYRAWVDNQNRPIHSILLQDIISSVEDLFNQVDRKEIEKNKSLIFSQLLRFNQNIFLTVKNTSDIYKLQDLVSELKNQLNQSNILDGTSYNSDFTEILINTVSDTQVPFRTSVTTIDLKYQKALTLGQNISIVILNKKISNLSVDEMDIFNRIYQIIKEENEIIKKQSTTPQLLPVNGVWQIIKLIVDDSVKNRLLADASIGNEHGSLLNAIRKICQDPFCEFFTDTYGDQFYFIARKKPFDREGIISMLDGRGVYEKFDPDTTEPATIEASKFGTIPPNVNSTTISAQTLVITLNESDVLSDSLNYSQQAYSWYRLQLKNLISGNDADMAFAYLKAVYFNEFADLFGSKPLDVTTNYIPYQPIVNKNQKLPTAYFIRQGVYDLKYLIESNAYLPFTRQGTIVLNGDRRIKRGTFVRLQSTNEIFYVDVVTNSFSIDDKSIDRITTLQVSRGMVEKYIKGVQLGEGKNAVNISYFDICNLPIDEKVFTDQQKGYSDFNRLIISKWKVNPTAFWFFVKKLQFAKDDDEIMNAGINFFNQQ